MERTTRRIRSRDHREHSRRRVRHDDRRSDDDYRYDDDRLDREERRNDQDRRPATGSRKKGSWVGLVVVIVIIGGLIAAAVWWSSKSSEDTRQAGPEAVVEAVVKALGTNSLSAARDYIEEGDADTKAELETLFDTYEDYFEYQDDYIDWKYMKYDLKNKTDVAAQVEVAGTAQIIEVEVDIYYDDFEEEEVEETIETIAAEYEFSGVLFGLKKVGEEWYLDDVPDLIF